MTLPMSNLHSIRLQDLMTDRITYLWRLLGQGEGVKRLRQVTPLLNDIAAIELYEEICRQVAQPVSVETTYSDYGFSKLC